MLEETGKLPTWSEFKNKALQVSNLYNVNWLKTEYHHTIASANMAEKWQDLQRTKHLYPNGKYVTAGDEQVRAKHKEWDGFVAPLDHPIWKQLLPPRDFGCRCYIIATDEPTTKGFEPYKVNDTHKNKAIFSGEIFEVDAYQETLSSKELTNAKYNLHEYIKNHKELVKTKHKNLTIELGADNNDLRRNYKVAAIIVQKTNLKITIRKHIEANNIKNPEYLIDGLFFGDRKSIEGTNNIRKVIDDAKKQMLNPLINPSKKPYYIVWDLDKIADIDWDTLIRTLQRKVTPTRGKKIKAMVFQYKGKAVVISREDILNRKFKKLDVLK